MFYMTICSTDRLLTYLLILLMIIITIRQFILRRFAKAPNMHLDTYFVHVLILFTCTIWRFISRARITWWSLHSRRLDFRGSPRWNLLAIVEDVCSNVCPSSSRCCWRNVWRNICRRCSVSTCQYRGEWREESAVAWRIRYIISTI